MISVGNSISGPSSNNDVEIMMKISIRSVHRSIQFNDRTIVITG
jgi:hypothetical protein